MVRHMQAQMGTQGIDPDDLLELQQVLAPRMTKREGPFPKGLTFNDMVAQASWKVRPPMLRHHDSCAQNDVLSMMLVQSHLLHMQAWEQKKFRTSIRVLQNMLRMPQPEVESFYPRAA